MYDTGMMEDLRERLKLYKASAKANVWGANRKARLAIKIWRENASVAGCVSMQDGVTIELSPLMDSKESLLAEVAGADDADEDEIAGNGPASPVATGLQGQRALQWTKTAFGQDVEEGRVAEIEKGRVAEIELEVMEKAVRGTLQESEQSDLNDADSAGTVVTNGCTELSSARSPLWPPPVAAAPADASVSEKANRCGCLGGTLASEEKAAMVNNCGDDASSAKTIKQSTEASEGTQITQLERSVAAADARVRASIDKALSSPRTPPAVPSKSDVNGEGHAKNTVGRTNGATFHDCGAVPPKVVDGGQVDGEAAGSATTELSTSEELKVSVAAADARVRARISQALGHAQNAPPQQTGQTPLARGGELQQEQLGGVVSV